MPVPGDYPPSPLPEDGTGDPENLIQARHVNAIYEVLGGDPLGAAADLGERLANIEDAIDAIPTVTPVNIAVVAYGAANPPGVQPGWIIVELPP